MVENFWGKNGKIWRKGGKNEVFAESSSEMNGREEIIFSMLTNVIEDWTKTSLGFFKILLIMYRFLLMYIFIMINDYAFSDKNFFLKI